jgi:hypothetical protein
VTGASVSGSGWLCGKIFTVNSRLNNEQPLEKTAPGSRPGRASGSKPHRARSCEAVARYDPLASHSLSRTFNMPHLTNDLLFQAASASSHTRPRTNEYTAASGSNP